MSDSGYQGKRRQEFQERAEWDGWVVEWVGWGEGNST